MDLELTTPQLLKLGERRMTMPSLKNHQVGGQEQPLYQYHWIKEPSEILENTPPSLLASWPKSSIFHPQRIAELLQGCQASWIRKEG